MDGWLDFSELAIYKLPAKKGEVDGHSAPSTTSTHLVQYMKTDIHEHIKQKHLAHIHHITVKNCWVVFHG